MKVLIVEDDKFLSRALKIRLEKDNIDTKVASNGEVAIEILGTYSPDVILLDLIMPIMDGFETLQKLKATDGAYKDIPVVVTSNLGQKEDKEKAMKFGANGYLVKSDHSIEEIVSTVKSYDK